jgi:hypothetical protein
VVQNLLDLKALFGVKFQEVNYKIFERFCYFIAQVVRGFDHFLFDLIDAVALKRGTSMDHFIQKNPQSPNTHPVIIMRVKNHFGSHVFISTTKGGPFSVDIFCSPPKIAKLNVPKLVYQ